MTTYARVEEDVAVEIFIPPDGFLLEDCFHPDVAALFQEVPDGTMVNSTWNGTEWVPPTTPRKRK